MWWSQLAVMRQWLMPCSVCMLISLILLGMVERRARRVRHPPTRPLASPAAGLGVDHDLQGRASEDARSRCSGQRMGEDDGQRKQPMVVLRPLKPRNRRCVRLPSQRRIPPAAPAAQCDARAAGAGGAAGRGLVGRRRSQCAHEHNSSVHSCTCVDAWV